MNNQPPIVKSVKLGWGGRGGGKGRFFGSILVENTALLFLNKRKNNEPSFKILIAAFFF
jgi:hypothetical protein